MNIARITDLSPKKRKNKSVYLKIMNKLGQDEGNLKKLQKATNCFFQLYRKERKQNLKNIQAAFIKLNLNNKKMILIRLVFVRLDKLIFNKNKIFFYFFCNQVSKRKMIWRNIKETNTKEVLSDINIEEKIDLKTFNKIKKVIGDTSTGNTPLETKVNYRLCKLFLSEKYGLKCLNLVFRTQLSQNLDFAFSMLAKNMIFKKTPNLLQNLIARKLVEKNEVNEFLKTGTIVSNKSAASTYNQIKDVHHLELSRIQEKLEGKGYTLRNKENFMLANWGNQSLQRIIKFYRKEYLIWGFSQLFRNYHTLKYRHKLVFNLYEKYRVNRIRDMTKCFMDWKMKSIDRDISINVYTLMKILKKLKKNALRKGFISIIDTFKISNGFKGKHFGFSKKFQAVFIIGKIYDKKKIIIQEMAFNRMKNENYLIEIANKITCIDKLDQFFKRKFIKIIINRFENKQNNSKNKIFNIMKYILKIRKVICFYRIYSYATLSKK